MDKSKYIVTFCEIDYDFCTWRYGEGDSNTAQHAWELDGDATDSAGSAHGTEIGSPTYQAASNVRVPGCQAVLGTSGPAKCFNTAATCQDRDNYNRGVKTLRYKVPSGFGS